MSDKIPAPLIAFKLCCDASRTFTFLEELTVRTIGNLRRGPVGAGDRSLGVSPIGLTGILGVAGRSSFSISPGKRGIERYFRRRISTPGSALPSSHSRKAPPAVET